MEKQSRAGVSIWQIKEQASDTNHQHKEGTPEKSRGVKNFKVQRQMGKTIDTNSQQTGDFCVYNVTCD